MEFFTSNWPSLPLQVLIFGGLLGLLLSEEIPPGNKVQGVGRGAWRSSEASDLRISQRTTWGTIHSWEKAH